MEGDLSSGDVNGSSLTYNPSAPAALGFGRSELPSSATSVPHTTPDSLPHYSSPLSYSSAGGNNMMVPTGGSGAEAGGPASMSASFSAPTGLCDSASPTSENGGGRGTPASGPASSLQRSHSTLSSSTSASKLEHLRSWGVSAYKCTRQLLNERLGRSSRTVDAELETSIEALRDTQRRYAQVLRLARALASHFWQVVCAQQQLAEAFGDLAQKSPELQQEFLHNAQTQRTLSRNGETLLAALNFFVSSVATLCHKTMEDTLATVRQYEQARVEYDAYRTDLEALSSTPRTQVSSIKLDEAQRHFSAQKQTYDQLRADVTVKLKFLNENKVKVMHKQLLLFHNAVSAYFSGNEAQLEATLRQFNVRVCGGANGGAPSWLEQASLS